MNYGIGDTVHYRNFGGGTPIPVVVDEKDAHIKNGRPGFCGTAADGTGVWGYDTQITKIERVALHAGMRFANAGTPCEITAVGTTHVAYVSYVAGSTPPAMDRRTSAQHPFLDMLKKEQAAGIPHRTTVEAFRALHAAGVIELVAE